MKYAKRHLNGSPRPMARRTVISRTVLKNLEGELAFTWCHPSLHAGRERLGGSAGSLEPPP